MEGYTFTEKSSIVYEWTIKNISSRLEKRPFEPLKSSEFSIQSKIANKFCLELYCYIDTTGNEYKDFVGVFIKNLTNNLVNVTFSVCLLNNEREKTMATRKVDLSLNSQATIGDNKFVDKKVLLADKFELIPDDTLTLLAEVTILNEEITTVPVEKSVSSPIQQLSRDLRVLYDSKEGSDVTLTIGDVEIHAHELILKIRSPVLHAMFTHNFEEKKTGEASIKDITAGTFNKLLEYIYTGEVSDLNSIAEDLLRAANKYEILLLKEMCEISLCKTLNHDNAVRRMDLADMHDAPYLIDYIIKCIMLDPLKIIESEDFENYEKSKPLLRLKLLKKTVVADIDRRTRIEYSTI